MTELILCMDDLTDGIPKTVIIQTSRNLYFYFAVNETSIFRQFKMSDMQCYEPNENLELDFFFLNWHNALYLLCSM